MTARRAHARSTSAIAGFPTAGEARGSICGQVTPESGTVEPSPRIHRNPVSLSTPATFNTTNARTLVW